MSRQRTTLAWTPAWEGTLKGWAEKYIKRNMWRCDRIHESDDLLQDAYVIYLKVCEYYPRVVEPKVFMGLFKASLANMLHDHSRYVRRKRELHAELNHDVTDLFNGLMGETTNQGYLQAALSEAPEELKIALSLLENRPELLRDPAPHGKRENFNGRLRRILGIEHFDFTGNLKNILEEA